MGIVVLGGTGLLGRGLVSSFEHHGLDVLATGRERAGNGRAEPLDVRDTAAVAELLDRVHPDAVVNAVGERRPEHWAGGRLTELNVIAADTVARACAARGVWLVHISTDYVFDGSAPPYRPESPRHPTNAYGESKVRAEDAVRHAHPDATLLRVPVLYGPVEHLAESNLTSLVPLVRNGAPAMVDDWAVRRPTWTADVGDVVVGMLERQDRLRGAVAHWSGPEALTKYALAMRIAAVLGLPARHLVPDPTPAPDRPYDTKLNCSLLESLGIGRHTSLEDGLRIVLGGELG